MTDHKYEQWINTLATWLGRTHFSDQTVESLALCAKLVEAYKPTVIIELGTSYGLSLRCWVDAAPPETRIVAIDAFHGQLRQSLDVLPLDMGRVELRDAWVRDVRLQDYWGSQDDVLLYVDIHSDHGHVFRAIPDLPDNSIVIFDDVWRSPRRLGTDEDKEAFFQEVVLPQVDRNAHPSLMPRSYAEYWKRGAFWGFGEVPELMVWCQGRQVTLHWEKGAKLVWFQWPQDKGG